MANFNCTDFRLNWDEVAEIDALNKNARMWGLNDYVPRTDYFA